MSQTTQISYKADVTRFNSSQLFLSHQFYMIFVRCLCDMYHYSKENCYQWQHSKTSTFFGTHHHNLRVDDPELGLIGGNPNKFSMFRLQWSF
jgi:hypothetical protein